MKSNAFGGRNTAQIDQTKNATPKAPGKGVMNKQMINGFSSGETNWTYIRQKREVGIKRLRDINSRHTTPSKFPKAWILEGIGEHRIVLKGKGAEGRGVNRTVKKGERPNARIHTRRRNVRVLKDLKERR